jgi:DNA-binding NarL/FixJ family response regulator
MSIGPRFLVVEDDELVGRAFASLLGERWMTAWARTLGSARDALATKRFSGIVLDAGLPDGQGLDFLADLRAKGDRTPCLFVSGQFDPALATRCHVLDAWCVYKPEVLDDVLVFAERSATIATSVAACSRAVVDDYSTAARLSTREEEILRLVLDGTPRSALAPELGMSENSIKTLVRRLLRKLDAGNLDEVARRVLEEVLRRERAAS